MIEKTITKYLTKKESHQYDFIPKLIKNNYYLIEKEKKLLLVKRIGTCKPKTCKAICCKMFIYHPRRDYDKGFETKTGMIKINKPCAFLKKDKCTKWGKSNFPNACKQFPHPSDSTYWESKSCTFKFKIIQEWKLETKKKQSNKPQKNKNAGTKSRLKPKTNK